MTGQRALRILHTEASLGWGGQEIRILTEARQCAAMGHEVRLICDPDSDIFRAAPAFGITPTAIPLKRKSLGALRAIRAVFSAWRPDIVNAHSSIDHWLSALARLGRGGRPPIVRTRHISAPVSRNLTARWLYNRGCEAVMTTSRAMVRDLTVDGFLSPDHVAAVPTGIDTDRFSPGPRAAARAQLRLPGDAFIFGTIATLRSWKGHGFLLDAFAKVRGGNTLLLIVGDGPQEANLREQILRLGLKERVHMVGRQDDVVPYLRAIDLFVLPSYGNEGVPQALLQAMSCEVPAIVTRVGGMPELVEGLEGIDIVEARDVDGLRLAMNAALARAGEEVSSAALRERILDRYTIGKMCDRVLEIFEVAIANVDGR